MTRRQTSRSIRKEQYLLRVMKPHRVPFILVFGSLGTWFGTVSARMVIGGPSPDSSAVLDIQGTVGKCSYAEFGNNTVMMVAMNYYGNSDGCQVTFSVQDLVAPVATCQIVTVSLNAAGTSRQGLEAGLRYRPAVAQPDKFQLYAHRGKHALPDGHGQQRQHGHLPGDRDGAGPGRPDGPRRRACRRPHAARGGRQHGDPGADGDDGHFPELRPGCIRSHEPIPGRGKKSIGFCKRCTSPFKCNRSE